MNDIYSKKSILQMARGAIQERADYEITKILDNILDPNTSATAARKLTITLTLKPDDTRQTIKAFLEGRLEQEVAEGSVVIAL